MEADRIVEAATVAEVSAALAQDRFLIRVIANRMITP